MSTTRPPPRDGIPQLARLSLSIDTPQLRLRPFEDRDVDALFPVVSRPEFPAQMSWAAHGSRDETLAFVRATRGWIAANTDLALAIEHAGAVVGSVGLHSIAWQRNALRVDHAELGYWLAPAVWGRGFATEAARALVGFGFATLGLHKITVRCFADNIASSRVIEKLGFRFVGRAEDDVWRDGRWHAHLLYELTAPEWTPTSRNPRSVTEAS